MRSHIHEKLGRVMDKVIEDELEAIYILSRVRKIIEIDDEKDKYRILNFYCDWSLHSHINNTASIRHVLEGIVAGRDEPSVEFFEFKPFHRDLLRFCRDKYLPVTCTESEQAQYMFNRQLSEIYKDAPLCLQDSDNKTYVTWRSKSNGSKIEDGYQATFEIVISADTPAL